MNILILNWRDIKNPLSGGAEILTQELSKRLVKKGHIVTQFSSSFVGSKSEEIIDGVRIIREGNPDARALLNSVQYKAYKRYNKDFKGKVDFVIDEVHGVPFFSVFYVKEKKAALICEIAGELWDIAVAFPFNLLGKSLEKIYPRFYKNIPILTISESSKKEIVENGFSEDLVKVLPIGSNSKIVSSMPEKEKKRTLVFLSRLSKSKGVEDAIKCVSLLKDEYKDLTLWIIGRGEPSFRKELDVLVEKLEIQNRVKFFNFVTEEKKEELLTRAHILIMPSAKEGWGLTIHEAGARATPSIVYNVPGLSEIVINSVNGLVCYENNPEELAKNVRMLFSDSTLYKKLQEGAILERKKHNWDKTADSFLEFINK